MSAQPETTEVIRATPEEYLRLEEDSIDKHEWINGRVVAMAGGSYHHSLMIANVVRVIGNRLVGKPCRALESNIRIRAATRKLYTYPDMTVVCGKPEFDPIDKSQGTLLNPKLVVEVLSPSTERQDRGRKFQQYQSIESLQEYVLISQHTAWVEVISREADGVWAIRNYKGLESSMKLRSIEIEVPLAEIYAGVEFPPGEDE